MMEMYDVIIIGGGASGMSCALYLKKQGISNILLIERAATLGGVLKQCIHQGFGLNAFKKDMTGPEFSFLLEDEIEKYHVPYVLGSLVVSISKDKEVVYINKTGVHHAKAKNIVLATGAMERSPGKIELAGERLSGIVTAGEAQTLCNNAGALVGQRVVILGSGDIGLIIARRYTLEGAKVLGVLEINPYPSGLKRNIVQCLDDFHIPLKLSTTVKRTEGRQRLESIVTVKVDKDGNYIEGSEETIACDGLILSCGLLSMNDLYKKIKLPIDKVDQNMMVKDGFYLLGNALFINDLVDNVYDDGIIAAKDIIEKLNKKGEIYRDNVIFDPKMFRVYPMVISTPLTDSFTFSFRTTKPLLNGEVVIKSGNTVIKKVMAPLYPRVLNRLVINKYLVKDGKLSLEITE